MRYPAAVIGLIATILVGALQQIAGSGLVDGHGLVFVNDLVTAIPIVAGLLIHQLVTPTAAPVLPFGTQVRLPGQDPDAKPAGIVSGASPNRP